MLCRRNVMKLLRRTLALFNRRKGALIRLRRCALDVLIKQNQGFSLREPQTSHLGLLYTGTIPFVERKPITVMTQYALIAETKSIFRDLSRDM